MFEKILIFAQVKATREAIAMHLLIRIPHLCAR